MHDIAHWFCTSLEAKCSELIFNRSIKKHDIVYNGYLGDGDSKGFEKVKNIYPDEPVTKCECVGHIQKRVGNRLRNLKKNVKGLKGLTDSVIDKLQNYYGIAIRSNVNNLHGIKSAIAAVLFHVASTDENPWHVHCPDWCGFKRAAALGTNT